MTKYFRPRRSMLYVPGCNRRYLEKAKTLKVDSIILDLGDPILIEAKEESRSNVVDFLNQKNTENVRLLLGLMTLTHLGG